MHTLPAVVIGHDANGDTELSELGAAVLDGCGTAD